MKLHELLPALQNLYGTQARAIDTGDGVGWAATYTEEGQYQSPSYDRPFRGREDLIDFGNSFPERSPNSTHLVSNVHIVHHESDRADVILTFVIVQGEPGAECHILRTVTAFDDIEIADDAPLIRSRRVEF